MNQPTELTLRAPDISRRFLTRTSGEVEQARVLLTQYLVNPKDNLSSLHKLAHKIRGSGALFGFEALSHCAHSMEKLAAGPASVELAAQLENALCALELQVGVDMRARAIAA
jgi:HPt (histidine-containing phosphotransfer) domain-containing protein